MYASEMHQVSDEVKAEFKNANVLVKCGKEMFYHVDLVQNQEWLYESEKKCRGIIDIVKHSQRQ